MEIKTMKNKYKQDPKMFKISFNAVIESIDKITKKVIKRDLIHNTIVNDGLNLVRDLLFNNASVNSPKAIAVGTDATAVAVDDTELGVEVIRATASITKPADYQVRYSYIFSVGSGVDYAIKEVGLFDSAVVSGSTLFARLNANNTLDADTDLSVQLTYTLARG
jgi:hypothetical protein